jgi:hypothetical protein
MSAWLDKTQHLSIAEKRVGGKLESLPAQEEPEGGLGFQHKMSLKG